MRGYPRKTCKKAQAASLSLLCHGHGHGHGRHGEDGLSALCEGVGGETCYPVMHKLRRPGRGFCGDPQIGDASEISIMSSSARRTLQASLIFGAPRRSPPPSVPPSVFGKHSAASASRLLASELNLVTRRPPDLEGDAPRDQDAPKDELALKEELAAKDGHQADAALGRAAAAATVDRGFWGRARHRLRRGTCCFEPRTSSRDSRDSRGGRD